MYYTGKIGSPVEFIVLPQEVPLVKVVEYLINFQPPNINQVLFDNLNVEYAWQCFWILKEQIESLKEKDDPFNNSTFQAHKPRGELMEARLALCIKSINLIYVPYPETWNFWLNVEKDWKTSIFTLANQNAKKAQYTKAEITSSHRKFKQTLLDQKNPFQIDKNPHLFHMFDASLKIIDPSSEYFCSDFLINTWNPFINVLKKWFNFEEKGLKLDNGQRAATRAWHLEGEETLVAMMGGRKKEIIYQPPQKNLCGRGRKKSENNPCPPMLSLTLPAEFGDFPFLEDTTY